VIFDFDVRATGDDGKEIVFDGKEIFFDGKAIGAESEICAVLMANAYVTANASCCLCFRSSPLVAAKDCQNHLTVP